MTQRIRHARNTKSGCRVTHESSPQDRDNELLVIIAARYAAECNGWAEPDASVSFIVCAMVRVHLYMADAVGRRAPPPMRVFAISLWY